MVLLAALALTRVLTSMLVEVKPTDPVTFVFVSVLFLLIAVIASLLHGFQLCAPPDWIRLRR